MAIWRYEAADVNGKVMRGAMDAPSSQEVVRRLTEKGYRQVSIAGQTAATATNSAVGSTSQAAGTTAAAAQSSTGFSLAGAPPPEAQGIFFRQISSLLHAGFTPSAAFADLAPRTLHRGLSKAAFGIAQATANGASLAGQLAQFPTQFAPHIIGLVAAGETGGFLPFAFEEAALGAEQDAALKQGLWLPKFLFWQSVWSVLLFSPLFPSLNPNTLMEGGLPAMGKAFAPYFKALFFAAIPLGLLFHFAAWLLGWMRPQTFARATFDRLSLSIPVMRRLATMRALAAFTRVLRRLLMAGISPEPAFVGAVNSVPNAALRDRLSAGIPVIRRGSSIDDAINATGMMEHNPLQMLVTGQKTGQWTEMLDQVTAYYQEEAARATDGARAAQKRLGVMVTLISSGYVTIVATHGLMTMGFKLTEGWDK